MIEEIIIVGLNALSIVLIVWLGVSNYRLRKHVEDVHMDVFETMFIVEGQEREIQNLEERIDLFIEASQKKPATRKPAARKPAVKKEAK